MILQRCKTWATETDVNVVHFGFHVLSISYEAGSVLNALYTVSFHVSWGIWHQPHFTDGESEAQQLAQTNKGMKR